MIPIKKNPISLLLDEIFFMSLYILIKLLKNYIEC